MKIVPIIDNRKNLFKKSDFELVYYAYLVAQKFSGKVKAVVIGNHSEAGILGKYGANEVVGVNYDGIYDTSVFTTIIDKVANEADVKMIVLPHTSSGKPILGSAAVRINAASVSGILSVPELEGNNFIFKKGTYSSKAYSYIKTLSDKVVVSLMTNSFSPAEVGSPVEVNSVSFE